MGQGQNGVGGRGQDGVGMDLSGSGQTRAGQGQDGVARSKLQFGLHCFLTNAPPANHVSLTGSHCSHLFTVTDAELSPDQLTEVLPAD